jgi:hypothetical protein
MGVFDLTAQPMLPGLPWRLKSSYDQYKVVKNEKGPSSIAA